MEYTRVEGLTAEDYMYPGEDNAFAALKKIPVLDQVMAAFLKYMENIGTLPQVQGDCYRITEKTCPEIYAVYRKAMWRLNIETEYPLYAKSAFEYNAYTAGGDEPYVVVHSSVLKNTAEEELLFVLGHELGHIKSGHLIYYMMGQQLSSMVAHIPLAGSMLISAGLHYALMNWGRMHEFTADRAGAIASGSVESGISLLGRLLGANEKIPYVKFGIEDLRRQNDAFEEYNQDIVSRLICSLQLMDSQHPWTISRIKELDVWGTSGGYEGLWRGK